MAGEKIKSFGGHVYVHIERGGWTCPLIRGGYPVKRDLHYGCMMGRGRVFGYPGLCVKCLFEC